jgi:hypothetical protein
LLSSKSCDCPLLQEFHIQEYWQSRLGKAIFGYPLRPWLHDRKGPWIAAAGAFVLYRAARDTEALAVAADAALASLATALAPTARGPDATPAGRQQKNG